MTKQTATNEPAPAADPVVSGGSLPKPTIRLLTIKTFRGIKELAWRPSPGLNVILGGGDVGKTTILDAIALLLSPTTSECFPIPTTMVARSRMVSPSRRS